MAENSQWRTKFFFMAGLCKPRAWLKLGTLFLLLAALAAAGRLFALSVLVKMFNVPPPILPDALYAKTIERRHQENLPLLQMGKPIVIAVVAAEDRRFYEHHGIDGLGALRAMIDNFKAGRLVEGGSTITQQLAKTTFLDLREKTANRKMQQLILAWELEDKYPKDRILEAYLNEVYFGNGSYGIEAASHFYFGEDARQLDLAQAAFLAGLVQAPSQNGLLSHRKQAIARQREILTKIGAENLATAAEVKKSMEEKLNFVDK